MLSRIAKKKDEKIPSCAVECYIFHLILITENLICKTRVLYLIINTVFNLNFKLNRLTYEKLGTEIKLPDTKNL